MSPRKGKSRKPIGRRLAKNAIEKCGAIRSIEEVYKLTPQDIHLLRVHADLPDLIDVARKMGKPRAGVTKLIKGIQEKTGLPATSIRNLALAFVSKKECRYHELSDVLECSRCAELFSSRRFPLYPTDRRCVDCIDLESISHSRKRRENLVRDLLQKLNQHVKRGHSRTPAITKLVNAFDEKIGGIEEVGRMWADQLASLVERNPEGNKLAMDQLREYAKFHFEVMKHEKTKPIEQMTDEELDSHEASLLVKRMGKLSRDTFQELARVYLNNKVFDSQDLENAIAKSKNIGTKQGQDREGDSGERGDQHVFADEPRARDGAQEQGKADDLQGGKEVWQEHGGGTGVCIEGSWEAAEDDEGGASPPTMADTDTEGSTALLGDRLVDRPHRADDSPPSV